MGITHSSEFNDYGEKLERILRLRTSPLVERSQNSHEFCYKARRTQPEEALLSFETTERLAGRHAGLRAPSSSLIRFSSCSTVFLSSSTSR